MSAGFPEFHALWYHLGPYGRQDIHLHPRFDKEGTDDVLVGFGFHCTPKGLHARKRLTIGSKWSNRSQEGQPLKGPVGTTPRSVAPTKPTGNEDVAGSMP